MPRLRLPSMPPSDFERCKDREILDCARKKRVFYVKTQIKTHFICSLFRKYVFLPCRFAIQCRRGKAASDNDFGSDGEKQLLPLLKLPTGLLGQQFYFVKL